MVYARFVLHNFCEKNNVIVDIKMQLTLKLNSFEKARFIRRTSHVPNSVLFKYGVRAALRLYADLLSNLIT